MEPCQPIAMTHKNVIQQQNVMKATSTPSASSSSSTIPHINPNLPPEVILNLVQSGRLPQEYLLNLVQTGVLQLHSSEGEYNNTKFVKSTSLLQIWY